MYTNLVTNKLISTLVNVMFQWNNLYSSLKYASIFWCTANVRHFQDRQE